MNLCLLTLCSRLRDLFEFSTKEVGFVAKTRLLDLASSGSLSQAYPELAEGSEPL